MMTAEQFTEAVLSRLMAEHNVQRNQVEYLIPRIVVAFDTEHAITMDQLDELIHGGDEGTPEELQKLFPQLNAVCLSPYNDIDDQTGDVEKIDDDEDDDDDDEDEEDDDGDDEED